MKWNPVNNKRDFVRRYELGEFGNRSPTWPNVEAFMLSEHNPATHYHVRNRVVGGKTWYDVPAERVVGMWYEAAEQYREENLYISAMAPTHLTLFQGEVIQSPRGLSLYYSRVPQPMRDSLKLGGTQAYNSIAVRLLQYWLCASGYDWLQVLLDRYPGHVVEFSTYERKWGTLPGYRTVFWEVRNY